MRHILILACAFSLANCYGQGWQRRYDMTGLGRAQTAWGIERGSDDGFVLVTASAEFDSLSPDSALFYSAMFLTRIDALGDTLWQQRHFLPGFGIYPGWTNCCDTVGSSGYIVGGGRQSFANENEVYLMRFDAQGDTLWTQVYGGLGEYWIGRQVKHTADGGFLIVGDTDHSGYIDGFALKTDALGNEQWRLTYGSASLDDALAACDAADHGDYFLGGNYKQTPTNLQLWVLRTDPQGQVKWQRRWGGAFDEPNAHLVALAGGHVMVASAWGYADDGYLLRPYLAKLDSTDGSTIWDRQYGPITYSTTFFAVKENPDQDLIACGVSYYTGRQQGLLLRATSTGDSLWMRSYYYQDDVISDGTGRFYDVLPTADGGFIATGATYHSATLGYPAGYSQDSWVVKVDADGCILPGCNTVGITEQATNLLDAFSVYPNPAQSGQSVTVQLSLPLSVAHLPLQLSVVGSDGRLIMQEAWPYGVGHSEQSEGTSFSFPLSTFSPGLYYVHIAQGGKWLTGGKLVVGSP